MTPQLKTWAAIAVALLAAATCAQQQPQKRPAPPPKPPTLGDLFPSGEPLGMQRSEPEEVSGDDVKPFLGESASGVFACGAVEAARVRYAFESDRELVAMLVRFETPDAARCAYDVGRPEKITRVDVTAGAAADRRDVQGLLTDHQLMVLLKGRRIVRIFMPSTGGGPTRARSLAQTLAKRMPSDGDTTLIPLLPGADLVAGSARVVARGPIPTMEGLVATGRYACGEHDALGFVTLRPDVSDAQEVRDTYQRTSLEDFMTVNPFRLGEVPVVSVISVDTHRETMLMHRGRMVMGLSEMHRRRDCAPVIESFAALKAPEPPDAGPPAPLITDGGERG